MSLTKIFDKIFSRQTSEINGGIKSVKELVIKDPPKRCNHHYCIHRDEYHITCIPKCGKKQHYREVTTCCECGQENYQSLYYTIRGCNIKDDNWAKS